MLNTQRKRISTSILVIGFLLLIAQIVYGNQAEPGSTEDPLVTQSYVEQRIEQFKFYVDQRLANVSGGTSEQGESSSTFQLVELKNGESLITGQGTELILRSGKALAVVSELGGLSNVTNGNDIGKDQAIPTNHLLIIPRDDGRGVKATSDAILMVKGSYTIQK
ncbi:hypothetical protein [Alkaliphilus peptidifermentans]|uniref:Uncharacterized protein n=1 Tax=Alkaliphilus peptidifermentans DSM 18978 TaxID=1120976 RepID=A0A1G5GCS1_9FIRM|nr:hypothetical protein [Alkaliphilus peptidifermentans]SCY49030.1 hypothetical protein SAMN03080606_01635 [Alkaliphilus peptidifermentans DSM 18978]